LFRNHGNKAVTYKNKKKLCGARKSGYLTTQYTLVDVGAHVTFPPTT